jgi:replicative DNA helicase
MRSKARRLKAREPKLGLIVVDYLQLMTSGATVENRVQEVSQISRQLKVLARDLDVPILALSQLSRAVEQRHDKRPILSDLRESGCLTRESRVYLPDEGVYRPIGELVGRSGFRVLAVDTDTWKLEPRVVERAFSTGRKPVLRLTTRLGRTIRATRNHKFLAFDGWQRLDHLAPGTPIALPRELPEAEPSAPGLTEAELALFGHLLGRCARSRHAVRYRTDEPELAALVADLAEQVFGDAVIARVHAERASFQVYLAGSRASGSGQENVVAAWLDRLVGVRGERTVPAEVFAQSREGIAAFLRHLWAANGYLHAARNGRYPVISYDAASGALADDVVSLLLRLGITARTRVVPRAATGRSLHRVDVSGDADVLRFVERVSAVGERRVDLCRRIAGEIAAASGAPGSDAEPALVVWGMAAREPQSELGSELYRSSVGWERAERLASTLDASELEALAASDVCWDEVVSVEPDGEADVFDLTVEGLHNFVAEDIVVHNSIEKDADLVFFVYRDEYYNGEESESQGLAELILSKHRNGPTDTVKLSFLKRYAKFADLAAS